jgi:hypothetical protein
VARQEDEKPKKGKLRKDGEEEEEEEVKINLGTQKVFSTLVQSFLF